MLITYDDDDDDDDETEKPTSPMRKLANGNSTGFGKHLTWH